MSNKIRKEFSNQEEGEEVLMVVFKHPFIIVGNSFYPALLFVLSLALMLFYFYVPYVFILSFGVFVFSIVWFFYRHYIWSRDRYVLTNLRIIDIEQEGIFRTVQKEAMLSKIQDISIEVHGIWGRIFKYGSLVVNTASNSRLTLDDIPNPENIQSMISGLISDKSTNLNDDLVKELIEIVRQQKNAP